MKKFTKKEFSWIIYDWANSAFATIAMAAILPIYFSSLTNNAGISAANSNAYWGYGNAIAGLLIALFSPILGTISDYRGIRKPLFISFLMVGVVSTFFLGLTTSWLVILFVYTLALIGFNGSNIFYDAFLADVTTNERIDKVSSWGFGMGYIGGSTIPFIAAIVLINFNETFGLSKTFATQISFFIAAIWWGIFSIPMLKNVQQTGGIELEKKAIRKSLSRLASTFKKMRKDRNMMFFLLAYFFYIDGVGTIIKMAAKYGESIGISSSSIIIALLVVQISAFPFAILFGRLANTIGSKKMILIGIGIYFLVCLVGFFMTCAWHFFVLSFLVGTSQGGIQALSRSYFGKLIPTPKQSGEYYGVYNVFGKFEAILGTTLMAIVSQATGKANFGVLSLVIIFAIGFILLLFVKEPKNQI